MNGRILSVALYEITEYDFDILIESKLKLVSFSLEGSKYAMTVSKNGGILQGELNCLLSIN